MLWFNVSLDEVLFRAVSADSSDSVVRHHLPGASEVWARTGLRRRMDKVHPLVPPLVFGAIVYPLVGLVPEVAIFWKFMLTLVLFNLATASAVLLISITFANTSVANPVGTLVMLFKWVDYLQLILFTLCGYWWLYGICVVSCLLVSWLTDRHLARGLGFSTFRSIMLLMKLLLWMN